MIPYTDEEIKATIEAKGLVEGQYFLIDNIKKLNESKLDFQKSIFVRNLSPEIINSNSNSTVLLNCLNENGVNTEEFLAKYNLKDKKYFSDYLNWMSADDTQKLYGAIQQELNKPNPRYFEELGKKAASNQPNLHKTLFALTGGPSLFFMYQLLPVLNRGFNNIVSIQYVTVKKEREHYKAILIVKTFENFYDDWDIKNFFWFGGNILAIPFIKGYKDARCTISIYQYSLAKLLKCDYGYLNLKIDENGNELFINGERYAKKVRIGKERIQCNYSLPTKLMNMGKALIGKKQKQTPQYRDILSDIAGSPENHDAWNCYLVEKDFYDAGSGEQVLRRGEVYDAPYFRYEIVILKKQKAPAKSVRTTQELNDYLQRLQEQVIELDQMRRTAEEEANRSKKAESELSELYKKLEDKVKERTQQLEQAKDLIEIQSKEKTAFFVNLAHETKTPATLITNYLDKCLSRYPEDRDLMVVKRNLDKYLQDMVNFLDAEKIEQGRLSYAERHRFDLTEYLNNKADLIAPSAEAKGLRIIRKIDKGIEITTNISAIDRILNNLLVNAMRYTPRGGSITLELQLDGSGLVQIGVIDTGIGIPEKNKEHIFEKYYQISHSKGNTQGIGMGLFITKSIVENIGGEISFASSDSGTEFRVRLPKGSAGDYLEVRNVQLAAPLVHFDEDAPIENAAIDENKDTVLLVEDNRELLLSMRESLAQHFNILAARNGKEALSLLNSKNVRLIVSDVMMDVMDGYELLEEVRKSEKLRDVPFVFLTARSGISEEIKGLTSGAIDYIQKPFAVEALRARINALLEYNMLKQKTFQLEKYRSVGMLTAGICHEIMNPLSGIKGSLYVVEKNAQAMGQSPESTFLTGIGHVRKNVNRIADIVGTMRSLFHGETYSFEELDLEAFLTPIIDIFRDKIGERITFGLNIPRDLKVRTNRAAFTQIFMNILSNSIEAIDGSGKIRIEAKEDPLKTLLVTDSGCGIPKQNLSRIFDLAFTTKRESGGSGLGLYIVKELSDRLGITVAINSDPNSGTEVALRFSDSMPPGLSN